MQLALGTAQFGLSYGVSNRSGQVAAEEAGAILELARSSGIGLLDTAASYGCAEAVLGRLDAKGSGFGIISKTLRLAQGLAAVVARAHLSVRTLGHPLDALLVHSAADLALPEGPQLWRAMQQMKADGFVRRIGVSAYPTDPILRLAEKFAPDVIQVPVSLLDQRLVADGTLAALAACGVEIHARSLFHQGMIFISPADLPAKLTHKHVKIAQLCNLFATSGFAPEVLAVAFARKFTKISVAVVGVTSQAELSALIAAWQAPVPAINYDAFALSDPLLLNPTQW